MSDESPKLYNVITILGSLGGLLMIVAAFFPLLSLTNPKEDQGIKWLSEYRQELQTFRQDASREGAPTEIKMALSVVVPSLDRLDSFLENPSGYRLWFILKDAHGFCGLALSMKEPLQLTGEQLRLLDITQTTLGWVLIFLSTIPLLGGYHIVRGLLLRFRKLTTPALCLSFFFGLAYALVAGLALFGVPPSERGFLGSAPYLLFGGALMMVFCSIFGVSRVTWWRVYLLNLLGLIAIWSLLVQALETMK
jgi:hypothetical protein